MLGQDRPEKNSTTCLIRSGEIPSPRQTSIDTTTDWFMKSERGARVGGSDPPYGHSVHNTTGDMWRAPARRLIQKHLAAGVHKTDDKTSRSLADGNPPPFLFRFGRRGRTPRAASLSPPIDRGPASYGVLARPSSIFIGLARQEAGGPWVDSMSRSKVYRRVSCF